MCDVLRIFCVGFIPVITALCCGGFLCNLAVWLSSADIVILRMRKYTDLGAEIKQCHWIMLGKYLKRICIFVIIYYDGFVTKLEIMD